MQPHVQWNCCMRVVCLLCPTPDWSNTKPEPVCLCSVTAAAQNKTVPNSNKENKYKMFFLSLSFLQEDIWNILKTNIQVSRVD